MHRRNNIVLVTLRSLLIAYLLLLPGYGLSVPEQEHSSMIVPIAASHTNENVSVEDSVEEGENDNVESIVEESIVEDSVVKNSVVEDSVVENSVVKNSVVKNSVDEQVSGDSPENELIALLRAFDSLHARFEQRAAQSEPQSGKIWLSKPNQFRLESDEPLSQTVVSDGTTLWTFDRDLEQVIIRDAHSESSEIPLMVFAGNPERIKSLYRVERFEDEVRQYFLLTPLADSALTASLSLTFQSGSPVRMTLENTMGQQTSIDLFDVSQAPLESQHYQFLLPEGADVIDDRVHLAPIDASIEPVSLRAP